MPLQLTFELILASNKADLACFLNFYFCCYNNYKMLGDEWTILERYQPLVIHDIYMVEWSRALDVRLSEWCCSVLMVWVQILSKEK